MIEKVNETKLVYFMKENVLLDKTNTFFRLDQHYFKETDWKKTSAVQFVPKWINPQSILE